MSRSTGVMVIAFLLFASLTHATRPGPVSKGQLQDVMKAANVEKLEGCEGVGEEECLARRTLSAHLDYIYTQEKKH